MCLEYAQMDIVLSVAWFIYLLTYFKTTSDVRELERTISERGFYVDAQLWKSAENGQWVTSQRDFVVVDDVATPGRGITTPAGAADHPIFADPSNNAVFHSLVEVESVLTQLQVLVYGSNSVTLSYDQKEKFHY